MNTKFMYVSYKPYTHRLEEISYNIFNATMIFDHEAGVKFFIHGFMLVLKITDFHISDFLDLGNSTCISFVY